MTNPLDELFSHVKKQIWEDEQKAKSLPKRPPVSQYANPDNWRLGKVVQLIHITEGVIGVYQEYYHKLSPSARRLLPANPAAAVDRTETVFGDHWLHPRFQAPSEPESSHEERAIVARWKELMQYEEDWDRKLKEYIR
jgi:hypothetical protein